MPPTVIPLRGTLGAMDAQNPTLLPLMDMAVNSGQGTLDVMSPTRYLAQFPRASAAVTCTVSGTITNLDTVKLKFTSNFFAGGSYTTAAYTIVTADTLATIAGQLDDLVDTDPVLAGLGVSGLMTGNTNPNQMSVTWNGPVGNFVTVSAIVTGAQTEVFTFGNSGVLAGGSGPIIPTANFAFSYNGTVVNFQYGKLVNVDSGLLAALVSQGRPII